MLSSGKYIACMSHERIDKLKEGKDAECSHRLFIRAGIESLVSGLGAIILERSMIRS